MSETFNFSKLYSDALSPDKATSISAGFDVFSYEKKTLNAGKTTLISTGIKVQPPQGTYLRVASRSGLSLKGITVVGGVIDPDFTGELCVILCNTSSSTFEIEKGMKIAQVIPTMICFPQLVEVDDINEPTERNDNGFGSSGL